MVLVFRCCCYFLFQCFFLAFFADSLDFSWTNDPLFRMSYLLFGTWFVLFLHFCEVCCLLHPTLFCVTWCSYVAIIMDFSVVLSFWIETFLSSVNTPSNVMVDVSSLFCSSSLLFIWLMIVLNCVFCSSSESSAFFVRESSSFWSDIVECLTFSYFIAAIVVSWNGNAFFESGVSLSFCNSNNSHYWSSMGYLVFFWWMYFDTVASNLLAYTSMGSLFCRRLYLCH